MKSSQIEQNFTRKSVSLAFLTHLSPLQRQPVLLLSLADLEKCLYTNIYISFICTNACIRHNLFCNLLLPITLPKTVLQAMVKNPPKSFFIGFQSGILDFCSFSLSSLANFLQCWGLWKTEPQCKQTQTLYPDHLSCPLDADSWKRVLLGR